jgi:septum formation protein
VVPDGPPALLLASGSPQRRAILTQIGVRFEVRVSGVEELEAGPAVEVALENAHRKAAAVAAGVAPGAGLPILGVDTVVTLGSEIFGKPADAEQAAAMIAALAGRRHEVISGLCVIPAERDPGPASGRPDVASGRPDVASGRPDVASGRPDAASGDPQRRAAAARTAVEFRRLSPAEVARYVEHGEWQGRAGGYAIQERGATLVRAIEGDYLNVVGLPVATLLDLMPSLLR